MTVAASGRLGPPAGFRGVFRDDDDARGVYAEAAGIGRMMPLAVAVPSHLDDVSLLVRWARERGISLVPRGSGSSMAGGAIGDGVVVDLSRLTSIDQPDPDRRSIRAGAGALRGDLDRRARSAGLRFPVDPSSGEFCTIAGMAATNAAGPRSLIHGATRPWVLALDCVFDDGSQATIRRGAPPSATVAAVERFRAGPHASILSRPAHASSHVAVLKDASGYATRVYAQTQELVDLLVGSEGTLALFTAAEIALVPVLEAHACLLVAFSDLERAVDAAVHARENGAAACELLDQTFLAIAARSDHPLPVAADTEAVLIVEVEDDSAPAAMARARRLDDAFRSFGADRVIVARTSDEEDELWSLRHAASPAIARMDPRLRSMQFIEDAAVPPAALASYVRGVRRILAASDTTGVIFGHAGDAHVHVNPLVDVGEPDWRSRVERILLEVTELVTRLDGTISGEHGDGRLRTPLLDRVWGPAELEEFRAIKQSFDPANVFNPGVKVPLPGQQAVDVVKYDPAIADLPPRARAALQRVERERAFGRFRIELL